MSDATLWWLAAGAAVALELATGTFYLLMVALGLSVGGLAAHLGAPLPVQIAAAGIVGGAAVAYWYARRQKQPAAPPAGSNRDVNLDIGSTVQVTQWNADGTARVQYRGASWSARWAGSGLPEPGSHVIRAMEGSQLLLDRALAPQA